MSVVVKFPVLLEGKTLTALLFLLTSSGGEWMYQDQEKLSFLFGWTSVFILVAVAVIIFGYIFTGCRSFFVGKSYPEVKLGGKAFSDINLPGYIPQVRIDNLPFPLLVSDVSKIDHSLIGWNDPQSQSNNSRNLLLEVPGLLNKKYLFSEFRHWCPTR